MRDSVIAPILLGWYDRHARALPWRVPPHSGGVADPYRIWLSEVMLQQTTVAAVRDYFHRFTTRWPTVTDLAAAADGDVMAEWAGLGYYARARNLLACARRVAGDLGGVFPDSMDGLRALPGIGPYTAAAIAAIAFDRPETVVDGNVERVIARLHAETAAMPAVKPRLRALAARHTPLDRPGDYAQAVMDLGATVCTPRKPACAICPLREPCAAHAAGIAAELPARAPKTVRPRRFGTVYAACRADGAWLLETRPPKGLLGGMLGLPGGAWAETAPQASPPLAADWRDVGATVRHVFTHFELTLTVLTARLPQSVAAPLGLAWSAPGFRADDLPSVMAKALRLAAAQD